MGTMASLYPKLPPSSSSSSSSSSPPSLHVTETELRLGLPGTEFPYRNRCCTAPTIGFGLDSRGGDTFLEISLNPTWNFEASVARDVVFTVTDRESDKMTKDRHSRHGGTAVSFACCGDRAHVVGWPQIRSFRKNTTESALAKIREDIRVKYVKVGMDGAPYLRKVDLKNYETYAELLNTLERMFSCFTIASRSRAYEEQPGGEILSERQLLDPVSNSDHILAYEDKDGDWMLVGDVPWRMFADSCRRMRIMKCPELQGLGRSTRTKTKASMHKGSRLKHVLEKGTHLEGF